MCFTSSRPPWGCSCGWAAKLAPLLPPPPRIARSCLALLLTLFALTLTGCGDGTGRGQALVGVTVIDGRGSPPVPDRTFS